MNKPLLIGFGVCLVFFLALPLLMGQNSTPLPPPPPEGMQTSAEPMPEAAGQQAWQEQPQQYQGQPAPAYQQPAAPQQLTAASLGNTVWRVPTEYGQATVTLRQGGQVSAKIGIMPQISGTWQVSGNALKIRVSFMGKQENLNCQIQGQQLFYNGNAAQRIQ